MTEISEQFWLLVETQVLSLSDVYIWTGGGGGEGSTENSVPSSSVSALRSCGLNQTTWRPGVYRQSVTDRVTDRVWLVLKLRGTQTFLFLSPSHPRYHFGNIKKRKKIALMFETAVTNWTVSQHDNHAPLHTHTHRQRFSI